MKSEKILKKDKRNTFFNKILYKKKTEFIKNYVVFVFIIITVIMMIVIIIVSVVLIYVITRTLV